ncbi:hypothetical protein BJY52DRAFT_1350558 [Lactarius psammicola]|nr:hypothetical protein BJY52DRAFT_1350558 [Lactarius psammicola]
MNVPSSPNLSGSKNPGMSIQIAQSQGVSSQSQSSKRIMFPFLRLIFCLYANQLVHPDTLIGTHETPTPVKSQSDVPFTLSDGDGQAEQSVQPVILYLTITVLHPSDGVIPLRLVLTSESRQALGLFAISHTIDVRSLKVMSFGENAVNTYRFTLRNCSSCHRTDWAANTQWEANARAWGLRPSHEHPRGHWRIKLDGMPHRDQSVKMTESVEQPGIVHVACSFGSEEDLAPANFFIQDFVCLFPFRSTTNFRQAADPNKELFMAKIPITS